MPLYLGSTQVNLPGAAALPNYSSIQTLATAVSMTTGAVAHTKGAWTEMIAATSGSSNLMVIYPNVGANGVDGGTIIDVAVGAVGSEVIIAAGIVVGGITNPWPVLVPAPIASGARVALRSQGVVASRATNWGLSLFSIPTTATSSMTTVDVFGANTATTKGAIIVNSSGWVEVVASTPRAYKSLILVPSINVLNNPIAGSYVRAGSGASAAEVELGRIHPRYSNTESLWTDTLLPTPFFASIMPGVPASTRLAVHTSSTTSMCACLIGVPA